MSPTEPIHLSDNYFFLAIVTFSNVGFLSLIDL